MMQALIAETRDCSKIQSQLIIASYEEAWRAIEAYTKASDKIFDMTALGRDLLEAIIEEIDVFENEKNLAELSLRRLGFWSSRTDQHLKIA
jgi:hypothetical protein